MNPVLGQFFTFLGVTVGLAVFWIESRRRKLWTTGIQIVAAVGLFAGGVAARLTELFLSHAPLWQIFDLSNGGKAIFGGVVGGWIGAEVAKRRLGIKRSTGDLFALALPAGEAVGRIGCHFNGCCYGRTCPPGLGVYQHEAWRYPTQLISAVVATTIFAVLWAMRDKLKEGALFKLYLVLFGISRFAIEFWRESPPAWLGLSLMQWVCVEMVVGVVGWQLVTKLWKPRTKLDEGKGT
ncbi:MAG: prolipoprotein diacylglyceryl transferase family protein [bacterium]